MPLVLAAANVQNRVLVRHVCRVSLMLGTRHTPNMNPGSKARIKIYDSCKSDDTEMTVIQHMTKISSMPIRIHKGPVPVKSRVKSIELAGAGDDAISESACTD